MNDKNIIKFSKCCAHLYGVVTIKDIQQAINHYNHEIVDEDCIRETLLKFISKRTTIQLHNDFVYKNHVFDSVSTVEKFHKSLHNFSFYYPNSKSLFYAFESSIYVDIAHPQCSTLSEFLYSHAIDRQPYEFCESAYIIIAQSFMKGYGPDYILSIMYNEWGKYLRIKDNDMQELFAMLVDVHNHTRRYDLRGFTPTEARDGVTSQPYL